MHRVPTDMCYRLYLLYAWNIENVHIIVMTCACCARWTDFKYNGRQETSGFQLAWYVLNWGRELIESFTLGTRALLEGGGGNRWNTVLYSSIPVRNRVSMIMMHVRSSCACIIQLWGCARIFPTIIRFSWLQAHSLVASIICKVHLFTHYLFFILRLSWIPKFFLWRSTEKFHCSVRKPQVSHYPPVPATGYLLRVVMTSIHCEVLSSISCTQSSWQLHLR